MKTATLIRKDAGAARVITVAKPPAKAHRARGLPATTGTTPVLKKILAPTDFSKESLAGVRYAAALAEAFGGETTLVYVIEAPLLAGSDATIQIFAEPETVSTARTKLRRLASREFNAKERVSSTVVKGTAFQAIIETARQNKVDLIVIATHGRTGIQRLVMGSTAENVVRHASCPVLTVPSWHEEQSWKLKKILVPIDFSNLSKDALPYATVLARASAAEIVLVSVVEKFPIDYLLGRELMAHTIVPLMQQAESDLHRIACELARATGLKIGTTVTEGKPFEEICRTAKDTKADMIVLTTHGYTGLKRMRIGSTAERVVRHADRPVLVVRELEHKLFT